MGDSKGNSEVHKPEYPLLGWEQWDDSVLYGEMHLSELSLRPSCYYVHVDNTHTLCPLGSFPSSSPTPPPDCKESLSALVNGVHQRIRLWCGKLRLQCSEGLINQSCCPADSKLHQLIVVINMCKTRFQIFLNNISHAITPMTLFCATKTRSPSGTSTSAIAYF